MRNVRLAAHVRFAILVGFAAGLQAQSFKATVIGTVVDSSGAVVPGATVSIAQDGTGLIVTTSTGPEGTFSLPQLPPGRYDLDGRARRALNGRNYTDLALLVPGMYRRPADDDHGEGLATSGTRTDASNFILDGVVNRSDRNASSGVNAGVDAIREFSVQTSTYSAEYGRTAGAQINVVSKSGTNTLDGSVFEYLRHDAFDANNYFTQPGDEKSLRRHQAGGNDRRPCAARSHVLLLRATSIRTSAGPRPATRRLLTPTGGAATSGTCAAPAPTGSSGTPTIRSRRTATSTLASGAIPFGATTHSRSATRTIFSGTLVNEARAGLFDQRNQNLGATPMSPRGSGFPASPSHPTFRGGPPVRIDGYSEIGDRLNDPFIYDIQNIQFFNMTTWVRARHNVKIGADAAHAKC